MSDGRAQVSRRHHTVPQFYLARFASERGQLLQVRLGDPAQVSPVSVRDASVRTDFYMVQESDGTWSDWVETTLGRIEGEAATGFRAALDEGEWPLAAATRQRIAYWLALQALRSPATRTSMDEVATDMIQGLIAAGGKDGLRAILEEFGDAQSLEDLDGTWELMSDFDAYQVKAHPNQHLELMLDTLEGTTRLMLARPWTVVRFERRALLTCDNPVVLLPGDIDTRFMGIGLGTAPEIVVPLSRRIGLRLGDIQGDLPAERWAAQDAVLPGSTVLADWFNRAVTLNSRSVLFCHPDDAHLVGGDLPQARTRETTGFDPRAWLPRPEWPRASAACRDPRVG